LAATILGSSLAFIDGTAVNVALPALQRDLHATSADLQWVIESYALFLAALILVGGSLGDHLGRRKIYATGIAIFTLASIWCGLAPTVGQLVLARAVEGIGAALLVPGSLALISASFDQDHRGQAIGTWSGFTTITSALGPVLGGWLVQNVSWRWVFFINVPLAAATLALLFWRVPESRDEQASGRLDWWGALLVTLGLGGVVYGLIAAGAQGFGQPIVADALGGGVVALALFVVVEARRRAPMMPLDLFRSRTFGGANALTLLLYGALGGALYFFPFDLQQVQGYSATAAGAALLPFTVIMFGLSRWAGDLVKRYGARLPLTIGPLISAAGFLLFMRPGIGGSYWTTFFPAVVVLALGMSITVAPLTTTVMGAVETRFAGVASGINNAVARTAGLLAIAVLGILVAVVFDSTLHDHLATLSANPAVHHALEAQRSKLAGATIPTGVGVAMHAALKRAVDQSFVAGFRMAMLAGAVLAFLSALTAAVTIEGKATSALPTPDAAHGTGTRAQPAR
jgi:EmrB/QacA subfamily drug resistance transporter